MKRLNAKRAPWLRATVVITLVACAFATLAGCAAAPKVEVESSQVQSDFESFADTLSDNLVQSPYVDNGDYALTAFDVSDSHVADDGANVFDATATFENGSFRTTMDVVATYAKDGDSYTPSFEVSNTSTKATSGIKYDPQGTLYSAPTERGKHRVTATLTGTASNGKPMVVGIYAGGDQYSDDWTIFYKASVQADDAAYTCGSSISKKI